MNVFFLLGLLVLANPPFLHGKLIKLSNLNLLEKIESKLDQFRYSYLGSFFDWVICKTGLYLALAYPAEPCIIPGKFVNFTGEIKVLTANLILFPPPILFDQKERIQDFVEAVRPYAPDIIFLQEVWDNNSLLELTKQFPDYWVSFTPSVFYHSSGLLTLSRFEIQKAEFFQYPVSVYHNFEELLACKGFLTVKLKIGENKILALNTHLYSASPKRKYRPNPSQFISLQNYVFKNDDYFNIIGGDMNIQPDEMKKLLDERIVKGTDEKPTAGGTRRIRKLDYIMIKPSGNKPAKLETMRLDNDKDYSDHNPVLGKITF